MADKSEEVHTEEAAGASGGGGGFFSRFRKKKDPNKDKEKKEKKGGAAKILFCFRKTRPVRNRKVKGKVKIDQTGNNELWQKIVDNSLVSTGVGEKAAVCSIESGGIIAYAPESFTPTVEQVHYLAGVTEEPDRCSSSGIKVADLHFIYRSGEENKALFGQGIPGENASDTSGVIFYRGRTKVLIVVYAAGRGDTAKKTCAELFAYFQDEQNGF